MRKYILMSLLLITAGTLFFALHEYVEVSVLVNAQARSKAQPNSDRPSPILRAEETEAECVEGYCHPQKEQVDRNNNTNLSRAQIAARYNVKVKTNSGSTESPDQ